MSYTTILYYIAIQLKVISKSDIQKVTFNSDATVEHTFVIFSDIYIRWSYTSCLVEVIELIVIFLTVSCHAALYDHGRVLEVLIRRRYSPR